MISNSGLTSSRMSLIVFSNCSNPLYDRYVGWHGINTLSAAAKALSVKIDSWGGQSISM